ncbi:MAG: aldehyde dehydrogenase family protein, partial [Burkholderiaceae bacterium]|nr:aldehyde dehydrogenase family protein [Burkholderiaceae bacterium]
MMDTTTSLLREQAFLEGRWVGADDGRHFDVHNPATGERLGHVPLMGEAETQRAIVAANQAWGPWRRRSAKERAAVLRRWFELMLTHSEALAQLMTREQGKPLAEARGEVAYAASFIEWFAEEGKRIYGETIPSPLSDRRLLVLREPIGVCAAITPWNFPLAMITRKVAPALAAGCPIIVKPAEGTPFSALALAALAE